MRFLSDVACPLIELNNTVNVNISGMYPNKIQVNCLENYAANISLGGGIYEINDTFIVECNGFNQWLNIQECERKILKLKSSLL